MSIPNSYNPSDYEYLLRSLTEGSHAAKAEALKRFQILAGSDKKQFAVYAKRIILAMQELMCEPKEEIDIQASMLVLEIINLNPKDIQYYIKTKLLKKVILNLGDSKPQLRKTSHYAILAFIKTFKSIDEVLSLYSEHAITSSQPQLRQKAINSLQSIIITDSSSFSWSSPEFKKIFQLLLQKLKDGSPYVQKASEQCLLTLSRMNQVHAFSKKLSPSIAGLYKAFCDNQRQLGNLQSINLEAESHPGINRAGLQSQHSKSEKSISQNAASNEKMSKITKQDAINKQALIQKIQQLRRNSQAPLSIPDPLVRQKELKEEKERQKLVPLFSHRTLELKNKEKAGHEGQSDDKKIHPVIFATKGEKLDNVFGKKLFEDLKNEKDWKIRLEAIEELASQFEIYKEAIEPEVLIQSLLPPLIKLLSDPNFKISTITLKVFEQFLRVPEISLETVAPQIVEKLADGKVVLRQGVARLIRSQYLRLYNPIWIDCLLQLMKRAPNPILKEEILGILIRLYEDEVVRYPFDKIIASVCPFMEDPKTKIKIRTLDLLVKITIATQKVDAIKTILSGKLNQVYLEMYLQKVTMENKQRVTPRLTESQPPPRGESRSLSFPSLRKNNISANNTTSTSLQKYSKTVEAKPIIRGTSDITPISNLTVEDASHYDQFQQISRGPLTPHQTVRKKPVKNNYKKRIQRSIETKLSITHTAETQGLRPFSDPEKELRTLGNDLKSDDWQVAFDALTKVRRLLKFHPEILVAGISRPLVTQTAKLIQSLRSSLSKNAVITLGQCAQVLKRLLDPELDNIFSRLMRKTLDTNSFISEEVKKTLILVSTNCNEAKVLSILVNYHTSRAIPIKLNILNVLQPMTLQPRIVDKEYEKIVSILVDFMGEGALEIRDRSKNILNKLLDEDKRDKISKLLPSELLLKFKKYKDNGTSGSKLVREASIMSVPSIKPAQPPHREELAPLKKKIVSFPKEFQELQELLAGCETAEWKIRQVSLSKIASLVKAYPLEVSQHRLNTRVIEMFGKHSNDPNSKVSTSALTHFMQIVPIVPKLIESNLSILSNQLFSCFASQKPEVRDLSLHLFDMIADQVENWMLVQHLCTGVLYGPAKAKPNILFKILKVLPTAYKEKRAIAEKHIVLLINKLADESKGDTLPILRQLISNCVSLGGDEVFGALKQSAKSLIES